METSAEKKGVFDIDKLSVVFIDSVESFPIGNIVYDVGEKDSGSINTSSSPGASSNEKKFAYSYLNDDDAVLEKIAVAVGKETVINTNDSTIEGEIDLDFSDAPVKYIISKIYSKKDGKEYVSYGRGCYCGAMDLTEDEIDMSKEKNEIELHVNHKSKES